MYKRFMIIKIWPVTICSELLPSWEERRLIKSLYYRKYRDRWSQDWYSGLIPSKNCSVKDCFSWRIGAFDWVCLSSTFFAFWPDISTSQWPLLWSLGMAIILTSNSVLYGFSPLDGCLVKALINKVWINPLFLIW